MKQSNLKTVRNILGDYPEIIKDLKPCFMMSPLSVSDFLDINKYIFDIVIFDEASQVSPEDSLASIVRAKSAVVVGDNKQLPPTNFFQIYQILIIHPKMKVFWKVYSTNSYPPDSRRKN